MGGSDLFLHTFNFTFTFTFTLTLTLSLKGRGDSLVRSFASGSCRERVGVRGQPGAVFPPRPFGERAGVEGTGFPLKFNNL
ncbi:Uncharacterised protein [Leclercia adecarboxylata]|uniref:Uncharacterized protein n=1 Tax=Leclercia adecarboxylata TaxID=83655 RepID=A0A4U9HGT9_9ENTR|nr:Uncharacterised protein [Leclercia adecarboxylata]